MMHDQDDRTENHSTERSEWAGGPAHGQQPSAVFCLKNEIVFIREIDTHAGKISCPPRAAGPRSEFELHRDIQRALESSDAPDCFHCRAADVLHGQAPHGVGRSICQAVLSPCGWISANEDAQADVFPDAFRDSDSSPTEQPASGPSAT